MLVLITTWFTYSRYPQITNQHMPKSYYKIASSSRNAKCIDNQLYYQVNSQGGEVPTTLNCQPADFLQVQKADMHGDKVDQYR